MGTGEEKHIIIHFTVSLKFPVVDCVCKTVYLARKGAKCTVTKDPHGQFHIT